MHVLYCVYSETREGVDGKRADRGGRGWEGGGENRKGEGAAVKIQRLIYDSPVNSEVGEGGIHK